ncbi:MAG TPA: hypothetical protein DIC53_00520 [Synergistaceae bacterium]|nr:hypothetical protein [Synergistaceae bacterium]
MIMDNRAKNQGSTMEEDLQKFYPLVAATAKRYAGRGAEFDDLVQEGYVVLLRLIPRCPDRTRLADFLKKRLPGLVRTAAKRTWRNNGTVPLDELETTGKEPSAAVRENLWEYIPEDRLTSDERRLVLMLTNGLGQKEAAAYFGITQQAVSARVRALRRKLAFLRATTL